MNLKNVNEQINKIGLNEEQTNAILEIIDLKFKDDLEKFEIKLNSINTKYNVLIWVIVVIILGFLSKLFGL